MEKDNVIRVNIDTRTSPSSPLNVTLSLINTVILSAGQRMQSCHNQVWSYELTPKLTKGTDYSGEVGFVLTIPAASLQKYFQTIQAKNVLNAFCLRLSYRMAPNDPQENSVMLPVELFRSAPPKTPVQTFCPGGVKLSPPDLKEIDGLYVDSKSGSFRQPELGSGTGKHVESLTAESGTPPPRADFNVDFPKRLSAHELLSKPNVSDVRFDLPTLTRRRTDGPPEAAFQTQDVNLRDFSNRLASSRQIRSTKQSTLK